MKLKYDQTEFEVPAQAVDGLRAFAIAVMDGIRKAEPETAHCWNVCRVEFLDLQPSFWYAGIIDDLPDADKGAPTLDVFHPTQLPDPDRPVKKARKRAWSVAETPSEQAMKRATAIVDALPQTVFRPHGLRTVLIDSIARAIDIPEGHVRMRDGVDRKVLGTLPISGDDCVVGFPPGYGGLFRIPHEYGGGERIEQCNPMHMSYDQASRCIMVRGGGWSGLSEHPVGGCYSNPQAARAAESARTHKETGNG